MLHAHHGRSRSLFEELPSSTEDAVFGNEYRDSVDASEPNYARVAESAEYLALRAVSRRFRLAATIFFLGWYLAFVVASAYDPEMMGIRLVGTVNLGFLIGFGQFGSTVLLTLAYRRFADKKIDPRVANIRQSTLGREYST